MERTKPIMNAKYKSITFDKMRSYMDHDKSNILLDVRDTDEYQAGHASGSVSLPLWKLEDGIGKLTPDMDTNLFVYCSAGVRSKSAAEKLTRMGYKNVYDLGGWRNSR